MQFEQQAFRASEQELGTLLAQVAALANQLGLATSLTFTLELILEELFLNTVHYGIRDTVDSHVYLSVHATSEAVRLIYEDYGIAYDPFTAVDRSVLDEEKDARRVGGLGILLVEGLATTAHYTRIDDHNRIELSFALGSPRP